LKQGIAPSSSQLIVRLQQSWPFHDLLGITNTGERIAFGSASGGRRFLANWRRRFGVTYGRLPPGSDLTAETIENQAGSQKRGTQKWNLPAGPHEAKETRGTHFWVPKSVSFSGTWKPKIGRKRVPLLGTDSRRMRSGHGRISWCLGHLHRRHHCSSTWTRHRCHWAWEA
jgi:hypothetical protein